MTELERIKQMSIQLRWALITIVFWAFGVYCGREMKKCNEDLPMEVQKVIEKIDK